MPGLDGTGPKGDGPMTGYCGQKNRNIGACPYCKRHINCPALDLDEEEKMLKQRLEEIQKDKAKKTA